MKICKKNIYAFLYLTIGYCIISILIPLLFFIIPAIQNGGSISTHTDKGVHKIRYDSAPGGYAIIYFSNRSGMKTATEYFDEKLDETTDQFIWGNAYLEPLSLAIFALISLPILRRIYKDDA